MEQISISPVCLKFEHEPYRIVSSVQQAWEILENQWPNDRPTRHKALQICTYVLQGRAGPTAARDALVYAAIDAGIYIDVKHH
jgi:Protein of unknown function (DUF982)